MIILPHPDADLALNISVLGSELISYLYPRDSFVVTEHVMESFLEADPQRTPDLFMDTLTFLFITDIIEYEGYKMRLKRNQKSERENDVTQLSLF